MELLSSRSKYAVAAMLEIAVNAKTKPIQTREIADKGNMPHNYLEQVLTELKKEGLIISYRGKHGGYTLARPASDITIGEIIESIEGTVRLSHGFNGGPTLEKLWLGLEVEIQSIFHIKLSDVMRDKQRAQKVVTYHI